MHTKRISVGLGKKPRWAVTQKGRGRDSIPILSIIRDVLGYADNAREARKILNDGKVQVDGKTVKKYSQGLGLMDVITISEIKKQFRVLPGKTGLQLKEIPVKEAKIKPCRITGKTKVKGGKIQYLLHDGSTILYDKEYKVADTLILSIPDRTVKKVIPFKKGCHVLVFTGRHSGETGLLEDMSAGTMTRKGLSIVNGLQTLTNYIFAIGEKKPEVTL